MTGPLLAIAHRAGNSLDALRQAVALGAHVVEADVHAYRGRLEVRHLKTMGPLPLLWDRWELRSAAAPRLALEEVLGAADGGVTFMLDLKGEDPAAGEAVATALHELAPGRPVVVCSRLWPALEPFEALPWARTVRSARTRAEFARLLPAATGYGVSVHRSLLTPDRAAALHERVEVVMTWPVNTPAALAEITPLTATGPVGVISDSLPLLAQVLTPPTPPTPPSRDQGS